MHPMISTFICLLIFFNTSFGQVPTVVLNGASIDKFIPFHSREYVQPTVLPDVDIQAVLAEDAKNGIEIPRFGVKMRTSVSKFEGEIIEFKTQIIWKKSFYALKAKSLNFEFTGLNLPLGAQIYIYDSNGTMFSGPIERKHVNDGKYSTDVILGNEVIIEVIIPKVTFESFTINISNVIYGFQSISNFENGHAESRDFGDSDVCEVDVNCQAGFGWENQRDAVALILVNNEWWCSGGLINNSCQDLDAFFLTAFHCLNGASGFLNWTFRFNYDSPNPSQPLCRGDEPTTWLTYSGANLRASWATSDFALLELSGSVIGQPTVALAGWNRNDYTPAAGVGIHHPNGDVKKISSDTDPLVIEAYGGGTGTDHLKVQWNIGITAYGSSGSPIFDATGRWVVGQLHGGTSYCNNLTGPDWYGRFFNSWTGGGTMTTRLSDWLGTASTTNTIRSPFITGGSGPICTTNKSFTLNNLIPGRSATWEVTPTNLFGTGMGAGTSGSGTTATLVAASAQSSGLGTLTFTISGALDCISIPVSIPIWVGKPASPVIQVLECFNSGDNYYINVISQGATNFVWRFPSCPNGTPIGDPDPECWFNYTGNGPLNQIFVYAGEQGGSISVWASNECGTSSVQTNIDFCSPQVPGPGPIIRSGFIDEKDKIDVTYLGKVFAYPNPADKVLTVELNNNFYHSEELKGVQLLDMNGKPIYNTVISNNSLQINLDKYGPGVFYLKVEYKSDYTFHKIIIL